MGDVLLETRTAYLSLKGTSHSLVRTRHRSRSAPHAAPAVTDGNPNGGACVLMSNIPWPHFGHTK